MNLKTFLESTGIDWSDATVDPDDGPLDGVHPFSFKPEDFITFAKADVFGGDLRGLVNALSNAKRAIDCEADSFVLRLGLDPDRLAKQLGSTGLLELNVDKKTKLDSPLKFRLLAALGIATPAIINRMRRLRNVLEHEYRRPRRRDVSDAIDVAELFVQACEGRIRNAWQHLILGSGKAMGEEFDYGEREVQVSFHYEPKPEAHFVVTFTDLRMFAVTKQRLRKQENLKCSDAGFVSALRLLWRSDINRDLTVELNEFLTAMGLVVPKARTRKRSR